jgi:preprotein translocase subunit SecG
MFALLVTLLIIDAIILSIVVLLQAGQGGGLASLGGGGTDTVLGGRQAVTILTKLTWWCGGVFMIISLVLSLVPRGAGSSRLQEQLRQSAPAPAQQAPLPLGAPTQPAAEAPKTAAPGAGASQKAPLPLGTPTRPAAEAPKGTPPPSAEKPKK